MSNLTPPTPPQLYVQPYPSPPTPPQLKKEESYVFMWASAYLVLFKDYF